MQRAPELHLGRLALDIPCFQAALSGYSDLAMRRLARRFDCPLTFAGVMLAKSAANPRVLRKACFRPGDDDHPVGAQILGRDPQTMARAARDLVAAGYDLIDLNIACPAPKVLRRGRGGALLNEPDAVLDIVRRVRDTVDVPLLVKLRAGWDRRAISQERFWDIVTGAVSAGVDGLVLHGRTVGERYRGRADWEILAAVKRRFPSTVVVGSGDVFDAHTSLARMTQAGLDGITAARGAVGNPWLFAEFRCLCEGRPLPPPPTLAEQREVILRHFDDVLDGYDEYRAVGHFRKFVAQYARRHPARRHVVRAVMAARTRDAVVAAVDHWYQDPAPCPTT